MREKTALRQPDAEGDETHGAHEVLIVRSARAARGLPFCYGFLTLSFSLQLVCHVSSLLTWASSPGPLVLRAPSFIKGDPGPRNTATTDCRRHICHTIALDCPRLRNLAVEKSGLAAGWWRDSQEKGPRAHHPAIAIEKSFDYFLLNYIQLILHAQAPNRYYHLKIYEKNYINEVPKSMLPQPFTMDKILRACCFFFWAFS